MKSSPNGLIYLWTGHSSVNFLVSSEPLSGPTKYRTEKKVNIVAFTCFRLASPVNLISQHTPRAPLWAHKPQNLSCGGIHGGVGSLPRTALLYQIPCLSGKLQGIFSFLAPKRKSDIAVMPNSSGLQRKFPTQHIREFFYVSGNLNQGTGNYQTRAGRRSSYYFSD